MELTLLDIGFTLIGFVGGAVGGYLVRDFFQQSADASVIEPHFRCDGSIAGFRKKG